MDNSYNANAKNLNYDNLTNGELVSIYSKIVRPWASAEVMNARAVLAMNPDALLPVGDRTVMINYLKEDNDHQNNTITKIRRTEGGKKRRSKKSRRGSKKSRRGSKKSRLRRKSIRRR